LVRISFAVALALLTFSSSAFADETPSKSAAQPPADANKSEAKSPEAKGDAAPATTQPATPAATPEPTIMLHVKSETPVTIEREDTHEVVCTSPCNKEVPATARYRVGGSRPSSGFTLDARSGSAKLAVDPASSGEFWAGVAGLGVGTGLIGAGVITLALGFANSNDVPGADGATTDTSYTDMMFVGTALVVTGVAAGIWGGATALANYRTTVKGSIMKDPPARGSNPSTTNRASTDFKSMTGPAFYVPIFGGAF
jgi:hypothetical protein